jgi:hypothetical protein
MSSDPSNKLLGRDQRKGKEHGAATQLRRPFDFGNHWQLDGFRR